MEQIINVLKGSQSNNEVEFDIPPATFQIEPPLINTSR